MTHWESVEEGESRRSEEEGRSSEEEGWLACCKLEDEGLGSSEFEGRMSKTAG